MADLKFVADFTDLQTMRRELVGVAKDAKQSAGVFEREYRKVERQLQQSAKANQQFFNDTLKVGRASKDAAKSAEVFTKELQRQEQATARYNKETERLKLQYNSTYRAAQLFKTQLRELGEAHARGAISADRHEQQVRELKNEYRAFLKNGGGPMNQFGQIASNNTRIMKRFGAVGMQQVGYQVQDFAVQVQSGTSVLVALGQQGSQLLGIFGPAGAIAGMILAIGTGLAGAFLAAKRASDETADGVENLDEKLKSLDATLQDWIYTKKALEAGMTVEQFLGTESLKEAEEDLKKAQERLRELREEVEGAGRFSQTGVGLFINYLGTRSADKDIAEAERKLEEAQERLNNIRAKAEEDYIRETESTFLQAQARIREENGKALAAQVELERKVSLTHDAYEPLSAAASTFRRETEANVSSMAEVFNTADKLRKELGDAAYEALRLSGVDMESGVDAAAKAAARLAADLNISLAAALAMQSMASKEEQVMSQPVVSGPAADRFGVEDLLRMGYTEEYLKAIGKIRDRTGGGGGGGTTKDPMEEFNRARDALASLIGQYDEGVKVAEQLRQAQTTVNEAVKAGVITTEQGQTAMQGYIQSLDQAENPMKKIGETLKQSLGDAFMSIVDGSKSASDAFKDMARAVLKQAFELMVIKPILDGLFGGGSGGGSGLIGSIFGFANGGAFSNGKVTAFANGGVVNSPTIFPMANGAGLMGEAGPEAIMPLKRGKNGKLGVQVEGGQQPVVINQSFNFAANGDESVKRIIAQEAPRIANLTQKQILDQRRRGGTFKSTFG